MVLSRAYSLGCATNATIYAAEVIGMLMGIEITTKSN